MDWLIDTNILIDHFRGVSQATQFLRRERKQGILWVSVITVAEIYAGQKMKLPREAAKVNRFLNLFRIAYLDEPVAIEGGKITREYAVALPDALIAATALNKDLTLATRNLRHFEKIPTLQVKAPY
ncbi:MAG: type II toxin-antitoxin system VapC family toxin [Acidobacteriota bacterium]